MSDKPKLSTDPYKGVRDFYPEEYAVQKYIFSKMREAVEKCGYAEYNASILEPSELYRSKGADNAEIINEQTYTFTDRGGREVTLRPEMTPTLARMVAARRRDLAFPLRWYSIPNIFRYERPQKGRLREHWQLNVDVLGSRSPAADIEIIEVAHGVIKSFGAKDEDFIIKINSRAALNALAKKLGLSEERRNAFLYLLDRRAKMSNDEFAQELDTLEIQPEELNLEVAPQDVTAVINPLKESGCTNVMYDPGIVRGFDYYNSIVFEVYDADPSNNRALLGGGRYDNLLEMFGDEKIPAVGFGMGDVAFREFLVSRNLIPSHLSPTQVYIAITNPTHAREAQKLAGELRQAGVHAAIDFGDKKLSDQIKNADKQNIPFLIVLGDDELAAHEFVIKDLTSGEEDTVRRENCGKAIGIKLYNSRSKLNDPN